MCANDQGRNWLTPPLLTTLAICLTSSTLCPTLACTTPLQNHGVRAESLNLCIDHHGTSVSAEILGPLV